MTAIRVTRGVTITTEAEVLDSIELGYDATLHAPNLKTVRSKIACATQSKLDAPALTRILHLTVAERALVQLPALVVAAGTIDIARSGELEAERVTHIDGLLMRQHTHLKAPLLKVLRRLDVIEHGVIIDAPRLMEIPVELRVWRDAKFSNDSLKCVGLCSLDAGASMSTKRLLECKDLYVEENATLDALLLERAGTIYLEPFARLRLPSLQTIQGDLGIGEGATGELRELREVTGDLHCAANARLVISPALVEIRGERSIDPTAQWVEIARVPKVKI